MLVIVEKSPLGDWNDHIFRVDDEQEEVWCGYALTSFDDLYEGPEYAEFYYKVDDFYRPSESDLRMLMIVAGAHRGPVSVPDPEQVDQSYEKFLKPFGLVDDRRVLTKKGFEWSEVVKKERDIGNVRF